MSFRTVARRIAIAVPPIARLVAHRDALRSSLYAIQNDLRLSHEKNLAAESELSTLRRKLSELDALKRESADDLARARTVGYGGRYLP